MKDEKEKEGLTAKEPRTPREEMPRKRKKGL
jgi:hypothetical protein